MLADNAGNNYQLHGDSTQLATHLGEEIQVQGIAEKTPALLPPVRCRRQLPTLPRPVLRR